ncbi:UNVERIFIED_CONTAM: hypothetical protein Slati_0233300 [Sesamum latifolium]|uniref:Gag-pol polyprotein n=1 Tax=Sesamum latifolium TaxID=2727402 RepID=A0AAW2YCD3_9LAMI
MRYQIVEYRFTTEQTHEIINLEHDLAVAEKGRLSLDDLIMIAISIEEDYRNQTHKMTVEHQSRANIILGKQKVIRPRLGKETVNMVMGSSSGASTSEAIEGYVSVQPELLTIYEPCDWLIDIGVNVYVCADKCLIRPLVEGQKKLGPKTVDVVFLGFVETSYALRFLVIKSEISGIKVNTIVEFRDVIFLEDVLSMKTGIPSSVSIDDSLASTSIPEHVEKMSNVRVNLSSTNLTHEESDEPRQSKRARVIKDFRSDLVTYNIEDDPITFKDVMASSEAKQWKEAVKSEMDSIVTNATWVLVISLRVYYYWV